MGGFSQDFIQSVRDAADITRVVADYVPLKQAGTRLKGLCPFHQEKTPSFSVDPTNQLFYCFGCQTGGDLFKFVMLYEKVAFPESVEMLARRFGVPLPAANRQEDDARSRTLKINELAAEFYRQQLPSSRSRCREYLEAREIDSEIELRLGLGYAPDEWEALRSKLLSERFKAQELLDSGMTLARKDGRGEYDRFRNRLIFPIRDVNGRTVAFGGRVIGEGEPKYINSPETPLYTKGEHLYGLDQAREAIRREGFAIVVEGYLDLAAVLRAKLDNVVASLGTAFTATQAKLLSRFTQRVVVSYDGDSAGAKAAVRSLDLLLEQRFEVRVAELPAGLDPDDYIGREGADAYADLVRRAPEYLQFLLDREVGGRDLNRVEEKVAAVNALLPHLVKLDHAIERAAWASRLADALQIEDRLVLDELRSALRASRNQIRHAPVAAKAVALAVAEARIVTRLLHSPEERSRWCDELDPEELTRTRVGRIVATILQLAGTGRAVDYPLVLSSLEEEQDRELLTQIAFRDEPDDGPTVEDCLWSFRRDRICRKERQAVREIGKMQQTSEGAGSTVDLDARLRELQELAEQRDAL